MTRGRRHDLACFAALVLLPCLWWWPVFAGFLPDFMDTVTHGYPLRMAAAEMLREGTLPLWLPNIFSGVPLAANPQVSIWYPPQLVFYACPGAVAYGIFALVHYVAGGIGMHALLRRMGRPALAALFGALTFQFGSMLVSRIALLPHVLASAWIPWMFWAIERAVRERGWMPGRDTVAVAAFFATQLLAGAPQIAYYTAIALPVVWIARRADFAPCSGRRRWIAQALVHGACAALLAAAIAAIQIVPTLEFVGETARAPIDVHRLAGQGLGGGFTWRALVGGTGDLVEDTDSINAIGIGASILAFASLARRRTRRIAWPFVAIGVLAYAMSLGALVPLWAKILPMYERFHAPRRALILWSVCGPVAAGLGAASLAAFARKKRAKPVFVPAALLLLSAGTCWMLPRLDRVWTREERLLPDDEVVRMLGTDRFVAIDPSLRYAYDSRRADFGRSMMTNLSALHGTMDANGYDPLVPKRLAFAQRVACSSSGVFYPSHGVYFTDPNSPILRLLNARYIVGRWDLFDPGRVVPGTAIDKAALRERLELVHDDPRWPVFRFRDERPLAWCVPRVVSSDGPEQSLLAAASNAPSAVAFTEDGLDGTFDASPRAKAEHVDARTIRVSLDPPPKGEAFVCVSVSWMPGWKATGSDGERLPTMPASGLIAGVVVPAGESQFTLRYAPVSFRNGALLTLLGLVLAVAGWRRCRPPA